MDIFWYFHFIFSLTWHDPYNSMCRTLSNLFFKRRIKGFSGILWLSILMLINLVMQSDLKHLFQIQKSHLEKQQIQPYFLHSLIIKITRKPPTSFYIDGISHYYKFIVSLQNKFFFWFFKVKYFLTTKHYIPWHAYYKFPLTIEFRSPTQPPK